MEIVFVRHAQKAKNLDNPSITNKGLKQTRALVKRFKKEKFDKLYCSDMKRAVQTASILSKRLSIKLIIDSSLREFDANFLKTNKKFWNKDMKNRFDNLKLFLDNIRKDTKSKKRILIVAHGNTNRLLMATLLELDLKNIIRFRQLETAVNEVYWMEKFGNWRLKYWNDTNHLNKNLINHDVY